MAVFVSRNESSDRLLAIRGVVYEGLTVRRAMYPEDRTGRVESRGWGGLGRLAGYQQPISQCAQPHLCTCCRYKPDALGDKGITYRQLSELAGYLAY